MKIKRFILGNMQTNGYVIYNEHKQCIVIDPADIGKKIVNFITEQELSLQAILLTHGHFDHIGAVDYLYHKYQCPIYIHQEDKPFLLDANLNLSSYFKPFTIEAPIQLATEQMQIGTFSISWLHLPGHTPGSSILYFEKEKVMFSGDVLFKGSIGRHDFPLSSHHDIKQSVAKMKEYDFDATVYPGHGESTTIKEEQLNNPFFQ